MQRRKKYISVVVPLSNGTTMTYIPNMGLLWAFWPKLKRRKKKKTNSEPFFQVCSEPTNTL